MEAECGDGRCTTQAVYRARAAQAALGRPSGGLRLALGAPKLSAAMGISQPQNLRIPPIEKLRPYGVRVSLPPGDPFRKLLGPDWQRLHWYSTPAERDAAMAEMSRRHEYSRGGDKPALVFQKIEKLAESRGL